MKWYLNQLQQYVHQGLTFDETIDLSDVKKMNDEIREISPVRVTGDASFSQGNVTFNVNIQGEMTLPCSRTLVDVEYPFDIDAREVFSLKSTSYGEDEEIHTIEGEILDLTPYLKEHILLEIPLQIFSQDDDKEPVAPQSGNGWEVVEEENQEKKIDPRLAKLQKFFEEE
jgi:uncharacterized protein